MINERNVKNRALDCWLIIGPSSLSPTHSERKKPSLTLNSPRQNRQALHRLPSHRLTSFLTLSLASSHDLQSSTFPRRLALSTLQYLMSPFPLFFLGYMGSWASPASRGNPYPFRTPTVRLYVYVRHSGEAGVRSNSKFHFFDGLRRNANDQNEENSAFKESY